MRRLLLAAIAALLAVGFPAGAQESAVRIRDNSFFPHFRVVFVGTEVTWTNTGGARHTVTFYPDAPAPYDSSPETTDACSNLLERFDCIEPGDSVSFEFTAPGTYDYYCKIHSAGDVPPDPDVSATEQPCGMCGRVVVRVEETPEPPPRRSPTSTPTPTATATPTEDPDGTPSPEPTGLLDDSPLASGNDPDEGGGGGAPRVLAAFALILALSGAGYVTWRRFLAR